MQELRLLDLYPINGPRYDAWERAKASISRLRQQGAIDLSKYKIKVTGGQLITEGCHRAARIYQLIGNVLVTGYIIDESGYDAIVRPVVRERKQQNLTIRTFLTKCLDGLQPWEY